ncbi:MAG: GFA family protein [Hyphomonas sp.]|nr:GFA family protein [Hyphomonas sp.]MCA8903964.1 GFA family protein [Hyphomonas sp.]MCB9962115.1 GFA family protein [Hyphomonas sp.]
MAERYLTGRCLCGAVTYSLPDAFEYALICHCSQCRRATGSAFKPFGGIPLALLRITDGEDRLLRYGDGEDHDLRCGTCGSLLYSVVRGGAYAHVTFGTLTDTPSKRPSVHIFAGSKADWDHISDGLPQFDAFPD